MRDCAGFTRLAGRHVVQHVLHGPAVRESALPHLRSVPGTLLLPVSPGALVSMEEQHQLLLDQLPLLRVSRVSGGSRTPGLSGDPGGGDNRARGQSIPSHDGTVLVLLDNSALQTCWLHHDLAGARLLLQLVHIIARHRHPGVKIALAHFSRL